VCVCVCVCVCVILCRGEAGAYRRLQAHVVGTDEGDRTDGHLEEALHQPGEHRGQFTTRAAGMEAFKTGEASYTRAALPLTAPLYSWKGTLPDFSHSGPAIYDAPFR
jgi:hypothetical protein